MKENEEVVEQDQESHREESCNISSNINEEDLFLDNNDNNINDVNDDDGKDDITADNPWGDSDDDDNDDNDFIHGANNVVDDDNNNDDTSAEHINSISDDVDDKNNDDDSHLQRTIYDEDKSIDTILELIKLFPMKVQNKNKVTGNYPLHTACSCYGRDYVAIELIQIFPEAAQHKNLDGLYPLHIAIRNRRAEDVVMKLIEVFPEAVSQSTKYGTALHLTCKHYVSNTLLAKLIEIYPLALQIKDDGRSYPIHCAVRLCRPLAFIKLLLDVDPLVLQQRRIGHLRDGKTPFHLACETNNAELVKYLMQRSDLMINIKDQNGMTPLHYACCSSSGGEIVGMLLNHPDVDVNVTEKFSIDTPLHKVIQFFNRPASRVNVVQYFLDHPCILTTNHKNVFNKTPLDLIKAYIDDFEKIRMKNNNLSSYQEVKLHEAISISNILEEFPIKKRWQGFCYHVKNFVVDLDL